MVAADLRFGSRFRHGRRRAPAEGFDIDPNETKRDGREALNIIVKVEVRRTSNQSTAVLAGAGRCSSRTLHLRRTAPGTETRRLAHRVGPDRSCVPPALPGRNAQLADRHRRRSPWLVPTSHRSGAGVVRVVPRSDGAAHSGGGAAAESRRRRSCHSSMRWLVGRYHRLLRDARLCRWVILTPAWL